MTCWKDKLLLIFFVWGSIFGSLFSCSGGSYKVIRNTLKSFFIKLTWVQFNVFDTWEMHFRAKIARLFIKSKQEARGADSSRILFKQNQCFFRCYMHFYCHIRLWKERRFTVNKIINLLSKCDYEPKKWSVFSRFWFYCEWFVHIFLSIGDSHLKPWIIWKCLSMR